MSARLFPKGDDRVPISAALALAAAIPALFFLLLSTVGVAALREGFEGLRPMAAAVAVLFLGIAGGMVSVRARWLASLPWPASRVEPPRRLLGAVADPGACARGCE